jgi:hypothetical protein
MAGIACRADSCQPGSQAVVSPSQPHVQNRNEKKQSVGEKRLVSIFLVVVPSLNGEIDRFKCKVMGGSVSSL